MPKNLPEDESSSDESEERSGVEDASESGSDSEDASGSDSEADAPKVSRFLNLMADEGDETEDSEGSEDDTSSEDELDDESIDMLLPDFSKLPFELRHRIWEFFCPEMNSRSRVFEFDIRMSMARREGVDRNSVWTVRDGLSLSDQTKAMRTVLAVHQESRAMALRKFPHALSIDAGSGDAIVRLNCDKDVVLINSLISIDEAEYLHLPNFADHIKNIAIGEWKPEIAIHMGPESIIDMAKEFPNLQSLFLCVSSKSISRKSKMRWCTSELVNRHYFETFEKEVGLGEDLQFMYAWPNIQIHGDFARFHIPRDIMEGLPDTVETVLGQKGIQIWPMHLFENARGMRRFESLMMPSLAQEGLGSDESSELSSVESEDAGTDLDEYEADWIDDEEIVDVFSENDEISVDGEADDHASGAQFSSPEPEPTTRPKKRRIVEDSDDEGLEAQFSSPEPEPTNRSKKRRIVEDSDDDSDASAQPTAKRARTTHIISSDSEDGPIQSEPLGRKSRPVVLSDSEEEEEEVQEKPKRRKPQQAIESEESEDSEDSVDEGESEESEESESDSDEQTAPRMTLAERLRLHRQENPIESEEEDQDGLDSGDGESEDEDDESEGGGGGRSRNAFFLDMADEEDEDEEEEEDTFYDED